MAPKVGNHVDQGVSVTAIAMKLLDLRLKPAGSIVKSVIGEFTAPKMHEIVVLRAGGIIELHRVETAEESKRTFLKLITRKVTRSVLRSCTTIVLPDMREALAVGADGGALSILDFKDGKVRILHCAIFGKTGCRRGTPGQYLASDPKGRAVLVSAVEKRKLVYVLNRDNEDNMTIASPLEAHRTRTITFDSVGVDNGYNNPIFATLELQYPDTDDEIGKAELAEDAEKQLAYYELDLGVNTVSRRWAARTHRSACCLAALPGGSDAPGGVLVGGENFIEYMHETVDVKASDPMETTGQTKPCRIVCAIPRRELHPDNKGILVTQIALHVQRKKAKNKDLKFFALAQTELGDVFKVMVDLDPDDKRKVTGLSVALLDVLPVSNSFNISKLGMLFVAAEFSDHALYQFDRIDLPNAPTCTSEQCRSALISSGLHNEAAFFTTENFAKIAPKFQPTTLKNLRKIYSMDNGSPTTGVLVGELAGSEVSPQIYTLNGRGPSSSLRVMRHGAAVTELAVSDLPGVPGAIFTITDNSPDEVGSEVKNDKFIVVSFADATLVLSVGDTVEEVGKESGFLTNAPTLACTALGNGGALCQIHPAGVRHIPGKGLRPTQWHCPGLKRIECAIANESQVLIALAGGEVIYFEFDAVSNKLIESGTRDMGADVCCLDVGTVPKGKSRSLFAVVGCRDQTVKIVSLEPHNLLAQRSSTALRSRPHSVALQFMTVPGAPISARDDIVLVIGLDDGSALRASVDPVTGSIGTSPTRRFLGARPVSVARVILESNPSTLLLSSRPWISRLDNTSGKHIMAPLSYAPLDHGCSFTSHAIREGIVATAGKTLRILSVDTAGMEGGEDEAFNINKVHLRYTPRQMTLLATGGEQRKVVLAIVESDYNEFGMEEKTTMGFDATGEGKGKKAKKDDGMDMDDSDDEESDDVEEKKTEEDEEDDEEKEARATHIRGPMPANPGHWGSCVRVVDPTDGCSTLECIEMGRNEAALCCTSVRFASRGGEALLAVGTVTGMTMQPLNQNSSHIALYRVNGDRLQLLHKTKVDDGPVLALSQFQGRLLVGIGNTLRLYEMGKRQLLRKCELKGLATLVKTLQTAGDRAYVGDMTQSVHILRYDSTTNRLAVIANDTAPRPITAQEILDWNTLAVGDKFGNITVLRLPRGADVGAVDLSSGHRALWESSREDHTPKMEMLCQYYVGEIVTSMTRAALVAGGAESLIYVTVTGRIGALVPFTSRDDVDLYTKLEEYLRTEAERPTGRDPQVYRSCYAPVKHVVDGDMCGAFNSLSYEAQSRIAEKLDRTVGEVMKKLEDTRNAIL